MNRHQRQVLLRIFAEPTAADIRWTEIEALFRALGGDIRGGAGSRVRVALNGVRAVFHRPHPNPHTKRGAVRSVREFLEAAGITPVSEHDDA